MTLSYDDNAASVFGVTMLLFYLFPASWYIIKRIRTYHQKQKLAGEGGEVFVDDEETFPGAGFAAGGQGVEPRSRAEAKKLQLLKASAKRDVLWTRNFKLFILFTVACALVFLYLLLRSSGQAELAQYDPYGILGLSTDASETEINKAYRKLARTYHPDMPTGDVEMFQKIKKAHDALTDPVVKENYRLYGNPDGRQALEVSIGLPNFLKGGVTGWLLVLGYMLFLIVAIPYAACKFYRKNKDKDSSTGLHNGTLWWLTHRLSTFPEGTTVRLMPEIIGGCIDWAVDNPHPKDDGTGGNPLLHPGLKELLNQCRKDGLFADISPSDPSKNRNRFIIPKEYVTRHALLLLAHCNKAKLAPSGVLKGMDARMYMVQLQMLKNLGKLCDLMVQMGVELEVNSERRANAMAMRGDIPPHQRPQAIRYFDAIRNVMAFQQLVTQGLWEGDRTLRVLFSDAALQSLHSKENKGHRPVSLAQYLSYPPSERPVPPVLTDAEKAEVDRIVPDLPILDVAVKAEVEGCDDVREEDILTVTVTVTHKNLVSASLGGYGSGNEDTPVPPVYAPSFPYPRKEEWWVFLVDEKSLRGGMKRIVFPAYQKFTPTKAVETVKMQMQAPGLKGDYNFTVHVLSSCYVDCDRSKDFSVTVLERLDSLAEAKKNKKRKGKKAGGKKEKDDDEDNDEGDDDEEEEEEEEDNGDMALESLLGGGNRDAGADYDSDLDAEGGSGSGAAGRDDGESTDGDDDGEDVDAKGKKAVVVAAPPKAKAASTPAAAAPAPAPAAASTPNASAGSSKKKALSAEEAAAAAADELLREMEAEGGKGSASGSAKKGGKAGSAKKGGKGGAASASKAASSPSGEDGAESGGDDDDDDVDFGAFATAGGRAGVTGGGLRSRKGGNKK